MLLEDGEPQLCGSCELGDGSACSFEATVEDNGDPGTGLDSIGVRDAAGNLVRSASELLGGGNIRIR